MPKKVIYKKQQCACYIPIVIKKNIDELAISEDRSINYIFELLLAEGLEKRGINAYESK